MIFSTEYNVDELLLRRPRTNHNLRRHSFVSGMRTLIPTNLNEFTVPYLFDEMRGPLGIEERIEFLTVAIYKFVWIYQTGIYCMVYFIAKQKFKVRLPWLLMSHVTQSLLLPSIWSDGSFDQPDRTFHSMQTSWELASYRSSSDVKELIPEFYFFPEFLMNKEGGVL